MDNKDKAEDQKQESEEAVESAAKTTTEEETQSQETDTTAEQDESQASEEENDEGSDEAEGDESSEEEEPEPSPRQNKAIERLTKRLAEANAKKVEERRQEQQPTIDDGEYTAEELNQRFNKFGEQKYSEGLAQAQQSILFQTRLEIDAPRVAQKYDVLNQNSENFDPGRASLVNELYLRTVGYDRNTGAVRDTNLRYEEFADGIMSLIEKDNLAQSADSAKNVAKQAARTGVRPNSVAKKSYQGADPRKMSDEQLSSTINDMLGIKPR